MRLRTDDSEELAAVTSPLQIFLGKRGGLRLDKGVAFKRRRTLTQKLIWPKKLHPHPLVKPTPLS